MYGLSFFINALAPLLTHTKINRAGDCGSACTTTVRVVLIIVSVLYGLTERERFIMIFFGGAAAFLNPQQPVHAERGILAVEPRIAQLALRPAIFRVHRLQNMLRVSAARICGHS